MPLGVEHFGMAKLFGRGFTEYNFDAGRRWAPGLSRKLSEAGFAEYNFDAVRRWAPDDFQNYGSGNGLNITLMPLGVEHMDFWILQI